MAQRGDSYYDLPDDEGLDDGLIEARNKVLGVASSGYSSSSPRRSQYDYFGNSDNTRDVRIGRLDQVDPLGSTLAGISARPDRVAEANRAQAELEFEERRRSRLLEDRDIEWTSIQRRSALETANFYAMRRNAIEVDNAAAMRDLSDEATRLGSPSLVSVEFLLDLRKKYPDAQYSREFQGVWSSYGDKFAEYERTQVDVATRSSAAAEVGGKADEAARIAIAGLSPEARAKAESAMQGGAAPSVAFSEAERLKADDEERRQFDSLGIPAERVDQAMQDPNAKRFLRLDIDKVSRLQGDIERIEKSLATTDKQLAGKGGVGQPKPDQTILDRRERLLQKLAETEDALENAVFTLRGGTLPPQAGAGGGLGNDFANQTGGAPATPAPAPTPAPVPTQTPAPPPKEEEKQTAAGGF